MLEFLLTGKPPGIPVAPADPYFSYVKLLMQFNGNGTDVKGHPMTASGAPSFTTDTHGTAVDLRSALSCYTTPNASEFNLGTNDWTIEAILNRISDIPTNNDCGIYYQGETAGNQQIFSFELVGNTSTGAKPRILIRGDSGTLLDLVSTSVPMTQNVWSHIAAVRQGTTISLYLDGSRIAQGSIGAVAIPWYSAYKPTVGARTAGGPTGVSFPGLMDAFRFTNGVARYTAASFTPPTSFSNSGSYRYVRLNSIVPVGNGYATLSEVQVLDTASATNWCRQSGVVATASTYYALTGLPQAPGNAIDGYIDQLPEHRWSSGSQTPPHWWMIDLGQARSFDSIKIAALTGANQQPTNFVIQGSNDGTNFDTLKTVTGLSLTENVLKEVLQ
jgi:hypothetical protein